MMFKVEGKKCKYLYKHALDRVPSIHLKEFPSFMKVVVLLCASLHIEVSPNDEVQILREEVANLELCLKESNTWKIVLTKGLEAPEGKVKELEIVIRRVELKNGETLSA